MAGYDRSKNSFESLKKYFDELDWKDFSDYEKERFARMKRNYESLQQIGINPAVPTFMTKKKRRDVAGCFQTGKLSSESDNMLPPNGANNLGKDSGQVKGAPKSSDGNAQTKKVPVIDWRSLPWSKEPIELIESDHISIDVYRKAVMKNEEKLNQLQLCDSNNCDKEGSSENNPRRSYPRRNIPRVCYEEGDVSSDDDYIYCDECDRPYDGSCPKHGRLVFVEDKKASPGPRFAWDTCPDDMSVCRSGIRGAGLGMWTEKDLIKGFVFGPYKGKIVKSRIEADKSGYAWEIRRTGKIQHFVDGLDTSVSNWMRFVNCAVCEERQNLIAFQYRGQIYYRIYKDIKACTELLVWYGDEFGKELGIYWNKDKLLLEGEKKSFELKGNLAPSSSLIIRSTNSQKYPEQMKGIYINQIFSDNARSSADPSCLTGRRISQHPEFKKSGIRGVSAETDLTDKVTSDVRGKIDCCMEKNMSSSVGNNRTNIGDTKKVVDKTHACSHCDYTTTHKSHLQYHVNAVHEGRRPHKCPQCDYRAAQATNLKEHVRAVHEGIKAYHCYLCDYKGSQASNLRRHINAVHDRLKPYKCQHCDYEAASSMNLQTHVNAVHEKMKPYKCQQCDHQASVAGSIRQHVAAVHEGKRPHQCPHCDYRATLPGTLRRHVKRIHGGMKSPAMSEV